MICPRLELLEGPMAVDAVYGSVASSIPYCCDSELKEGAGCSCSV